MIVLPQSDIFLPFGKRNAFRPRPSIVFAHVINAASAVSVQMTVSQTFRKGGPGFLPLPSVSYVFR